MQQNDAYLKHYGLLVICVLNCKSYSQQILKIYYKSVFTLHLERKIIYVVYSFLNVVL